MLLIFIIGIVFITISLTKAYNHCPPRQTVYRYVPRTFIEDQENPVPLDDLFYSMFNDPSAYVASVDVTRRRQDLGRNLNKYYISAL
jgi:hypothetical protein